MLFKLFKKEIVYSDNIVSSSCAISPYMNIAFLLVASIFVPVVFIPLQETGFGNIILFLYLMVCARFFMALAGLDARQHIRRYGQFTRDDDLIHYRAGNAHGSAALAFILKTTDMPEMFGTDTRRFYHAVSSPVPGSLFSFHNPDSRNGTRTGG